ncbi:pirin [Flavobacterium araucananum]|uniref:Pirin N-terminal domain-containing protein n=1 Tax=Flavobacterium araucananum TaxID=946678 RepID=A0A227P6I5_9FLAO|nr:pirin family protein [Flavobacterium araucananum]OXG05093.1 hypothetical protein B0A64_13775 [Flavobacterium araucananum]PWJ96810.1 pirin [Flavobacterium araucananum]
MIQIQKKTEQSNRVLYDGNFIANKPVAYGTTPEVEPYSNLFYFSHAVTIDPCEFPLHPHKGFEIMTFVLEGEITHYDTESKKWTSLEKGDFQIFQCNSGIQHQERLGEKSRGFQIWFDPDFNKTLYERPTYKDYQSDDFLPQIENQISTINYVGDGSKAISRTPGLKIKKLLFENQTKVNLQLEQNSSYTFYILQGKGIINGQFLEIDDAVRVTNTKKIDLDFKGELFYIQTPAHTDYPAIWMT